MNWKFLLALLAVAGLGGAAYLNKSTKPYVVQAVHSAKQWVGLASESKAVAATSEPVRFESEKTWDGLVPIAPDQAAAIGLRLAKVQGQREPMVLELNATTAYDPDSLTQIRPRFDSLVTNVLKTLGDRVKKGTPLVELYSNELATAKNDLQIKYVQWLHDHRLLVTRKKLRDEGAISELQWVETQNNEAQSKLGYDLAYDKLKVFGLQPEEINPLLEGLNDESMPSLRTQNVSQKASMTLRSPAEGIIVKREVVPGNLYEPSSVLMVIAPLDHLRVYANVYERDIDVIQVGQEMVIHFPYLDRSIKCHVEVISNQVDPETHAMRVRTTITNPGSLLKSDMLARAELHVPAVQGYTVIPRNALVTTNGKYYVFVKKGSRPASDDQHEAGGLPRTKEEKKQEAGVTVDLFERRAVRVRQERSDQVIIAEGLHAGEDLVANGSLIVEQMYEDLGTTDTGTPL